MSKRLFTAIVSILLIMVMLVGCSKTDPGTSSPGTSSPGASSPGTSSPGTSSPGTPDPGAPERSRTVTLAGASKPSQLEMHMVSNSTDYYHAEFFMESLIYTDHTGQGYSPMLAQSWESSADAKEWTFKLQEGVKFHNGEDFDADDVVCSFQFLIDMKDVSAVYIGSIPTLQSVEKIDQYTVKLVFSEPFPLALNGLRSVFIFPNEAFEELGYEALFRPEHSYGTGPWIFSEWVDGEYTTFKKNENYWNKAGYDQYFDTARYLHANEPSSIVAAHLAGEINAYGMPAGMNTDLVPMYDSVLDRVELVTKFTSSLNFIFFQMGDKSPFKDENLRKAVSYAIDRPMIYETIFSGMGMPAVGTFHPQMPVHDPNNTDYYFDLDLAKEYVEKSDYDGRELFMVCRSNTTIEVTLSLAVADMLAKVGINVTVDPVDSMTFNSRRDNSEYDLMFTGTPFPDQIPARFFASLIRDTSKTNHNDEKLVELITLYNTELDDAKRVERGREVGNYITSHVVPYVAIGHPPSIWACDWDLTGINFFSDGTPHLAYVDYDPLNEPLPAQTDPFFHLR